MQYPRVILETELCEADRNAIMGGKGNLRTADSKPPVTIRFVQTGERRGFPILVLEEAGENDSMGSPRWRQIDLPWTIVASLLMKHPAIAQALDHDDPTLAIELLKLPNGVQISEAELRLRDLQDWIAAQESSTLRSSTLSDAYVHVSAALRGVELFRELRDAEAGV